MIHAFTDGIQFLVRSDEFTTGDWDESLSKWKGKPLTVKEVLEDGCACTVNENDEEWIIADVDWTKMETIRYYWWKIDNQRFDYHPVVVCYTYGEVEHIKRCYGTWFSFTRVIDGGAI